MRYNSPLTMHNEFMARAIQLSIENVHAGRGGPFGAVVVKSEKILAEGANCVTSANDPTAHAEIVAIRNACKALSRFDLSGCALYTSCEPCPMCLGAIYWARLDKVFFACTATDASEAGFDDSLIYREISSAHKLRKIPFEPAMREEGLAAFRVWAQKMDKIPY